MNLIEIASKLFLSKLSGAGQQPGSDAVQNALQNLLPTSAGDLDIAALVAQFTQQGGLASLASSWLGDGGNEALSPQNLISVLGESRIADFASQLGLDQGAAAGGLSAMLPELIDKASSGGSLKQDLAGSLASGLAGKLFG